MARGGESQGLQIALIIFVILTVIASVTSVMFFKQAEEASKKSAEDQKAAVDAQTNLRNALDEISKLKSYIGAPNDNTTDAIGTQFSTEMDQYAGVLPLTNRTYRDALATLVDNFRKADDERKQERVEITQLQTRLQEIMDENTKLLKEQTALAKDAASKLSAAESDYKKKEDDHLKTREGLQTDANGAKESLRVAQTQFASDKKKLEGEIVKITQLKEDVIRRLQEAKNPKFETEDGEIRWVNQKSGTVWISVGRADSLPKQMTFSVWGRTANDINRGKPKAKVEVTQILGEHLSEARIVEDSTSDPIVAGDLIATSIWNPGRGQSFAIVGFIDLDDDGLSDQQMLTDLIAMRGSRIDAQVNEDGKIVGHGISLDTKYVIKGKEPTEHLDKYTEILKQAEQFSLPVVSVAKFLDEMGWKDPSRVVRFGGGNPKDFPAKTTDGARPLKSGGPTSGVFKKRSAREKKAEPASAY